MNYFAIFDNVQLTSITGVEVRRTNPFMPARRKLTMDALARSDKSKASGAFYNDKKISIGISITRSTRDLAEQSLDALFAIIQGVEKDLVLSQAGGVRRYIATYEDISFKLSGGSYLEFDLIFTLSDAFGYDTNYTTLLNATGRTLAGYNDVFTFGGSAPWQVPVIRITYTAVTGGTSKDVMIGNNANGQQITINRTWAAGDVIEIDAYASTVKVNDVEVAYTGAIPEFAPGSGTLGYSDSLTTRTMNERVYYYKRYV